MGEADLAQVDVAVLLGVARQYDVVAEIVDSVVRAHLTGMAFDGVLAGRAHVDSGDAVRTAVDRVTDQLRQWSRAATEIAVVLGAAADRYDTADADAARRLR
jgi:excreted virulence factor EspC (type VII ESX diderm)